MKSITHFLFALLLLSFTSLQAQQLQVAGGHLRVDNSSLVLKDVNFVNNANFSSTSGNVEMTGESDNTIGGTSETTFSTLTINKTSGEVQLTQNAGANDNLQFDSGKLDVQTSNFTMGSSATITGADADKHVQTSSTGALVRPVANSDVSFPVGNSAYNPAMLNNAGTSDNFSVRVEDEVLDTYSSGSAETEDVVNRAWHIEEETMGDSDVTVTLQWNADEELTGFDRTQSGVAAWDGSVWNKSATYTNATANGADWTQTRSGVSDFTTPFAIEDVSAELGAKEVVQVKIFLQGPYSTDAMNANLGSSLIPATDPYTGTETASSIAADVVDWVQVEIRNPLDNTDILATKSALLRNDGQILDADGSLGVSFNNLGVTSAYIAVKHRNHLAVMTGSAVNFTVSNID